MRKILSACLICCLAQLPCFAQVTGEQIEILSKFANTLRQGVIDDGLKGSISALAIKDNKVIWTCSYGTIDPYKTTLVDTNTIYRIGSITKTFTATLLMLLIEEKKISLDDNIEKYVPEVKKLSGYTADTKITIKQLASHTSGIERDGKLIPAFYGNPDVWEDRLIQAIPYTSIVNKPGTDWLYSNIGFSILGLAIERAAHQSYLQMIQQRILTPLHMHDTFYLLDADRWTRLASGLDNTSGKVDIRQPLKSHNNGMGYTVPNGALYSTPGDLAKFVMSMMGKPSLLQKSSLRKMRTPVPNSKDYGLGLFLPSSNFITTIGHDGLVAGYNTAFVIAPETGYAIVLMRNYNIGSTNLFRAAMYVLGQL